MSLRVANVRTSIDEPEAGLADRLRRVLGVPAEQPLRWRILRKALDARDSHNLQFVYTAEVSSLDEETLARLARRSPPAGVRIDRHHEESSPCRSRARRPIDKRVATPYRDIVHIQLHMRTSIGVAPTPTSSPRPQSHPIAPKGIHVPHLAPREVHRSLRGIAAIGWTVIRMPATNKDVDTRFSSGRSTMRKKGSPRRPLPRRFWRRWKTAFC
jgi:hypothetical protein